jgi:predicted peroxiredoxin
MKTLKAYLLIVTAVLTALLVVVLTSGVWAGATPTATAAQTTQKNAVVHLTHFTDDLHAASMALMIAGNLQKKGAQVTLHLDLEGVRLADARQPDLQWGEFPPIAELYTAFVEAGGEVLACPACSKAAGLTPESLRPGAKIGKPGEDIPEMLLAADIVLDY